MIFRKFLTQFNITNINLRPTFLDSKPRIFPEQSQTRNLTSYLKNDGNINGRLLSTLRTESRTDNNLGNLSIRIDQNNKASFEPMFLKLAKQLRYANYTAYEHIPLLEQEIALQLKAIVHSIMSVEQQKLYLAFQTEFEQRKLNQKLTYEWWIIFAYRLSILITPIQARSSASNDIAIKDTFADKLLKENLWHTDEDFRRLMGDINSVEDHLRLDIFDIYHLRQLIKKFPEIIMVPSTEGDIPIHSFNEAILYHVIPLGIVSNGLYADGQFFYPDRFFRHDIGHAKNWFASYIDYQSNTLQLFIKYMLDTISHEKDIRKKSQLDLMLFVMTHEDSLLFISVDKYNFKERILRFGSNQTFYDLCLNDKWLAPLIRPYLAGKKLPNKELIEYVDESINLMEGYISRFFNLQQINNFMETALERFVLPEDESEKKAMIKGNSNVLFKPVKSINIPNQLDKITLKNVQDTLIGEILGLSDVRTDPLGNIRLIFEAPKFVDKQIKLWANIDGVSKAIYPNNCIEISETCTNEILEKLLPKSNTLMRKPQ